MQLLSLEGAKATPWEGSEDHDHSIIGHSLQSSRALKRTSQEEVFNEAYRKGSFRIIDTVRARLDAWVIT